MTDPTARTLRLLARLADRPSWTAAELARDLGTSERTVRADVTRLRDLGYRVEGSRGVGGGYRLAAGAALPPLVLDDEEAVAVAVALRTAVATTGERGGERAGRALGKLERVLPARLRGRVAALAAEVDAAADGAPEVDADVLARVAGAVHERRTLRFDYVTRDGRSSRRHVEPVSIAFVGFRWYLVAWDPDRDDWRTFRLDRLRPHEAPHGRPFRPRPLPDGDGVAHVRAGVRRSAAMRVRVRLPDGRERTAEAEGLADALEWIAALEPDGPGAAVGGIEVLEPALVAAAVARTRRG